MDATYSTNRKLIRMFANILSIFVILAMAFPATGNVYAEEPLFLRAFPDGNAVDGGNWPLGTTVYLAIDDPATVDDPDYTDDATVVASEEGWISTYVRFDFDGAYDLKPGDEVTLSAGGLLRYLVVPDLRVTKIDPVANVVAGTIEPHNTEEPYTLVHVFIGGDAQLYVYADSEGAWVADFNEIGFDLQPWMSGNAEVWFDEFNDSTIFGWTNPRFTVFPEWEWFDGLDWPNGAMVTITVADKPECETTKESWGYFFNGSFGEECDLEIGDTVTFTDGETIRTHTVQNLAIPKVNQEDNIVKGIADAGAEVHVWPHATGQEQLATTNPQGKWNVDFTGIYDLMPGDGGRSEIRDEMGNATAVDWYVSKPRIVASITEDWFYLQEFSPDTTLDFTVFEAQDEKPVWKGTATTDGSGFAWINAEGRWDLEPGNYLVVNDGSNSKDLVIEGFTFEVFDLSNGQLSGTAPEPYGRRVWVGIGFENDGWSMEVTTDGTGAWLADFGTPVPSNYQWVAAQIFDDDSDASELRPDRVVDLWVAAYTYDAGTWSEGSHNYHYTATWNGGSETTNEIFFNVSGEAQAYDGYVLLRPGAVRAAPDCAAVDAIRPDQPTRFHVGYVTDYPMTYSEALAYFASLTASAVWDGGQAAALTGHEIIPFNSDDWTQYACTFTSP